MATLADYFAREFTTLMTHSELTVASADGSTPPATFTARIHYDTDAHVRFVSYFLGESVPGWLLDWLMVADNLTTTVSRQILRALTPPRAAAGAPSS